MSTPSTTPLPTPFNELLRLIAHSRYDRLPVVDAENHFYGILAERKRYM